MSIEIVSDVLYLPFKPGRKLVLTVLAEHADIMGFCWPSQQLIGLRASISVRKVRDHLKSLEKQGWIRITRNVGPGMVNYYELNMALISDIAEEVRARRKLARDSVTSDTADPAFATPDFSDFKGDFKNILADELKDTPGPRGPREPSANLKKETAKEPSQEPSCVQQQLKTLVVSKKAKSLCMNRLHDWAEFESSDKEFSSRQEKGLLTALADASSMFSEADLLLEMEVWDFLDDAGKTLWSARIEEACEA
jgi:DNA-binding MarR family transcriptional regulator